MPPKLRIRGKRPPPPAYERRWRVAASTERRNDATKAARLAQAGKHYTCPNCCAAVRVLDSDPNPKKITCGSCTFRTTAGSFRRKIEVPDPDVHAYNEFEQKYQDARLTALESTTRTDYDKHVDSLNRIASDGHAKFPWLPDYIMFAWNAAEREQNWSESGGKAAAPQ